MTDVQKVALVTGASRGIGRAIAEVLGKKGYIIAGTATSEKGAEAISTYLQQAGINGKGYMLNICDDESVAAVYAKVTEDSSAPSILVNNAAVTDDNLFLRMKPEQWNKVIDTNLNSVYRMTKACLRAMLKQRFGRVITITSVVGVSGNPGQANYCAAKAGVIGFSKSLGQEMAAKNITFNTIAPGFIKTDMTDALTEQQQEAILTQIPMKRMGGPEDIAHSVAFLASDEAAYITGQTLHVNGGMYML
jgi:3-oxoacyl-[acyl-carrier protein] reductase